MFLKIGHNIFALKPEQKREYQKYLNGKAYDEKWLHMETKRPYFMSLSGTKMYIVEAEEQKDELPQVMSGKVVENGGGYYAIKVQVSGQLLFQSAKELGVKGHWRKPKSWTAYGKTPLGPHVSLTASTGKAHLGKHVELKVRGWNHYVDGSGWIVLDVCLPKGYKCPYNDCHISCAQDY